MPLSELIGNGDSINSDINRYKIKERTFKFTFDHPFMFGEFLLYMQNSFKIVPNLYTRPIVQH